jgi:hypothetical protein
MMEFTVNRETGPFLVSSTRSVLWVTPKVPKVRAASRPMQLGSFFNEVVRAVVDVGGVSNWGNVHPLTPEGLINAVAHLRSYDLTDLEILSAPKMDMSGFPLVTGPEGQLFLGGLPLVEADWLEPNTLVVLPQDRDYVGFVIMFGERGLAVVHNACRGIAVCQG